MERYKTIWDWPAPKCVPNYDFDYSKPKWQKNQELVKRDAVSFANAIRYDELIAEKIANRGPYPFDGDDNCEDCDGWDGEDRRCQCGNRRVSWESEGDFTNMWLRAVAY